MAGYTVLYNPLAGCGKGRENAKKLEQILSGQSLTFTDMTTLNGYTDFFSGLDKDEKIIISGGDGTLNRFVNESDDLWRGYDVYYYAAGSGNDFLRDIAKDGGNGIVRINKYIENLPTVTVNGMTKRFINGIGYGIDGYCCEVADAMPKNPDKPINYAAIAIKGVLFHYKPTKATVTVDGREKEYKKVWIAPTMNGRFYGGGMMPTPSQDRLSDGVSTMIYYGYGRLKTLAVFPSIFKGEHIKHTEMVEVTHGSDVTVRFDRPVALQIDGETVLGVSEYSVSSKAKVPSAV